MPSPWTGHRVEGWLFEILDASERLVGVLDAEAVGGTLEFSTAATIRGSGNVVVAGADALADWSGRRLRISYTLDGLDPLPLITALTSRPAITYTAAGPSAVIDVFDKLAILADDSFGAAYALPAGTPVMDSVRDTITSTGEPAILVGDSDAVLAAPMTWEAAASKLRTINDRLDAAGMYALWCDGLGRYRATAYVAPSARGIAWTFTEDAAGLYLPDFKVERDPSKVPNRYYVVGRTEGDASPLVGVATDEDPASPYSYPGQRWKTRTDTGVDAASQTVADLLAARRLTEAQQPNETITIKHPPLPIGLNDVVAVESHHFETPRRYVVQKQTYALEVGGLVTTTGRRVL